MGQGWGREEDREGEHWDMLTPQARSAGMQAIPSWSAHCSLPPCMKQGMQTLSAEGLHQYGCGVDS